MPPACRRRPETTEQPRPQGAAPPGLVIDYDPLPFTQGRIIKLSPDKRVHEVELFAGYPRASTARGERVEVFRPDTRLVSRHAPSIEAVEVIDDAHLRITKAGGGPSDAEDLVAREPRLRSGNADAFHSKHALVGPRYLECVARFMGDDAVNICGDYHLVMAMRGRALRVLAKHRINLEAGDDVELVAFDGRRLPDARVVAVRPAAAIDPDEAAWLKGQRMNERLRTNAGNALTKGFDVDLDRELDLPRGSVIASTRRMGNGFVIDRCTFGSNRSRGILIKASHGTITGCTLEGSWEVGILVAPEWWWLESGSSSDLVISGNRILNCPTPRIVVKAIGGNGQVGPAGAHRRVRIVGNRFENVAWPCIPCTSTDGLTLADNDISGAPAAQATWKAHLVPAADRGKPVVTVACTEAVETPAEEPR